MARKKILISKNLEYEAIVSYREKKKILTFKGHVKFPIRLKPILLRPPIKPPISPEIKNLSNVSKK